MSLISSSLVHKTGKTGITGEKVTYLKLFSYSFIQQILRKRLLYFKCSLTQVTNRLCPCSPGAYLLNNFTQEKRNEDKRWCEKATAGWCSFTEDRSEGHGKSRWRDSSWAEVWGMKGSHGHQDAGKRIPGRKNNKFTQSLNNTVEKWTQSSAVSVRSRSLFFLGR